MRTQLFKPAPAKSWYKIQSRANNTTEVLIYDEIGGTGIAAQEFVDDLNYIKTPHITVRLNTPGGGIFEGFTIYNALKNHPAKVETYIDGLAASIGSVIALAGDTVHIAANGYYMVHLPWTLSMGNATDLRQTADLLDKLTGTLAQIYMNRTGKSAEKVTTWMEEETWFTAEEALSAGLVDRIVENERIKARFDLSVYAKAPKELKEETSTIVDTIRDFEAALREELGFSHREAKKLAAGGWPAFDRDDRSEADSKGIALFIEELRNELKTN